MRVSKYFLGVLLMAFIFLPFQAPQVFGGNAIERDCLKKLPSSKLQKMALANYTEPYNSLNREDVQYPSAAWIQFVPVAEQVQLELVVSREIFALRTVLTFSHSGFRVQWGDLTRAGNTFRVNARVEMWTGGAQQIITVKQHDYDLGHPENGQYEMEFQVWDQVVSRKLITVPVQTVSLPLFTPDGGHHANGRVEVSISCPTPEAVIHYTIDGREPSESSPSAASGQAVTVPVPGMLKARAWKPGWKPSATHTARYFSANVVIDGTDAPWISALYLAYWGRAADPGGLDYWAGLVGSGILDELAVAENFALSQEARDVYPYLAAPAQADRVDIEEFVRVVYQNLTNLTLENNGDDRLANLVEELFQKRITPGRAVERIFYLVMTESGEGLQSVLNKVFVSQFFTRCFNDFGWEWQIHHADRIRQVLKGVTWEPETVTRGEADIMDMLF